MRVLVLAVADISQLMTRVHSKKPKPFASD